MILFYYRPLNLRHHGETQYVRNLVDLLTTVTRPEVVAPTSADRSHGTNAYLTMIRNVLGTNVEQLRYLLRNRRRTRRSVLVIVDAYSALLPLIWARLRNLPVVYVASDPPERYAESLRSSGIPGGLLLRVFRLPIERRLFSNANMVVCRSSWMASQLVESGVARARICVLPHPPQVEPPDLAEVARVQAQIGLAGHVGIVFLGDFEYPPNREALSFILEEVLPVLRREAPDARLVLVGPGSERWVKGATDEVVALGPVSNLSQVLYASAIGISPSVVAGGTSAKTIDYLAHGLMCVVTPTVAQSLDPNPRLLIAPRDRFAATLVSLARSIPVPRPSAEYFNPRLAANPQSVMSDDSTSTVIREICSLRSTAGK